MLIILNPLFYKKSIYSFTNTKSNMNSPSYESKYPYLILYNLKPTTPEQIKNKYYHIIENQMPKHWRMTSSRAYQYYISDYILDYFHWNHSKFFDNQLLPHVHLSREDSFFYVLKNKMALTATLITPIVFQNLQKLTLKQGNLTTIQFVAFLNAENLHTLNLGQNYITNYKPIAKTHWKQLMFLALASEVSTFHQFNHLSKVTFFKESPQNNEEVDIYLDLSQNLQIGLINQSYKAYKAKLNYTLKQPTVIQRTQNSQSKQ